MVSLIVAGERQDVSVWMILSLFVQFIYWCFFISSLIIGGFIRAGFRAILDFRPQVKVQRSMHYIQRFWWDCQARRAFEQNGVRKFCWQCQKFARSVTVADFSKLKSEDIAPKKWISRPLKSLDQTATHCCICQLIKKVEHVSLADRNNTNKHLATLTFEVYKGFARCEINASLSLSSTSNESPPDNPHSKKKLDLLRDSTRIRIGFIDQEYPNRISLPDHQLVLLAEDAPFLFTFARKVPTEKIDIIQVKGWLEACEKNHSTVCGAKSRFPGEPELKLPLQMHFIDVQRKNIIISSDSRIRYAALSYVWGPAECNFICEKKNFGQLCEDGGLLHVLNQIPQTVKDAMDVVQGMGERYLWVDAICITQDDDIYKSEAISSMDAIYSLAFVTIIAASGPTSNFGLLGVRPGSRTITQDILDIKPNLRLVLSNEKDTHHQYIKTSVYNTRAWTYQERLLSRRSLLFINSRVYFECSQMCCREDEVTETPGYIDKREHMISIPTRIFDDHNFISITSGFIADYSTRQLSNQSDELNAFAAASRILSAKLNTSIYYGLFESHFDWALLWSPTGAYRRRDEFPTWSWTGWNVPVSYALRTGILTQPEDYANWLESCTWIEWYRLDGSGLLRQVRHLGSESSGTQSLSAVNRKGQIIAQLLREIVETRSDLRNLSSTLNKIRRAVTEASSISQMKEAYPTKHYIILSRHGFDADMSTRQKYGYPYLFFWTFTINLRLTLQPKRVMLGNGLDDDAIHNTGPTGGGLCRLGLEDRDGTWRGSVVVNDSWQHQADQVHEFLLLSKSMFWDNEEFDLSGGSTSMWLRGRKNENTDKWFVMLVVRVNDIAERAGIGKIETNALGRGFDPGLQWREIVLG